MLFNVIAAAQAIPSELFEVAQIYKLSLIQRWKNLILPGIFPYLITGIITAVGGAWNASIVSEYVQFKGEIITTDGLGETISQATALGKDLNPVLKTIRFPAGMRDLVILNPVECYLQSGHGSAYWLELKAVSLSPAVRQGFKPLPQS